MSKTVRNRGANARRDYYRRVETGTDKRARRRRERIARAFEIGAERAAYAPRQASQCDTTARPQ